MGASKNRRLEALWRRRTGKYSGKVYRTPHPGRRTRLRDALMATIAEMRSWDLFVTLTFRRRQTTQAGARAVMLRWMTSLPPQLAPSCVVYVTERQSDGTAHIHALWAMDSAHYSPSTGWRALKELWYRCAGIGRFYPYDARRAASGYLAKYIVKSSNSWGIYERGVCSG